jgi:hypothetical protein
MGNIMYPLEMYNPASGLGDLIEGWITEKLNLPWWLEWMVMRAIMTLVGAAFFMIEEFLPAGLTMNDIGQNTDGNPITVMVRRHKRNNDLGLWNFRYGTVESQASAHVYRQAGDEHIRPVFIENIGSFIGRIFSSEAWTMQWFDTRKHLFETELMTAR